MITDWGVFLDILRRRCRLGPRVQKAGWTFGQRELLLEGSCGLISSRQIVSLTVRFFCRFAQPKEIADMLVVMSSDKATFMTGSDVVVDGGCTFLSNSFSGGEIV